MFRLEYVPVIVGVVVALWGAALIYDARRDDGMRVLRERRRRPRAPRNRPGEALIGVGMFFLAASMIGRDNWRYGTVSVLAGSALLLAGAIMNRAYLKELLLHRGAARRAEPGDPTREKKPDADYPRPRIR